VDRSKAIGILLLEADEVLVMLGLVTLETPDGP
jgi:hypothetical protein